MTEPPIDRDPDNLDPEFRRRLAATLGELALRGKPFKFNEGFRTVARQQWHYGSGRPSAKPYGRSGQRVTARDGVKVLSNHQGTGKAGTGRAADCYPIINGKVVVEPPAEYWELYASVAEANGLSAGHRWKQVDSPHVELLK